MERKVRDSDRGISLLSIPGKVCVLVTLAKVSSRDMYDNNIARMGRGWRWCNSKGLLLGRSGSSSSSSSRGGGV